MLSLSIAKETSLYKYVCQTPLFESLMFLCFLKLCTLFIFYANKQQSIYKPQIFHKVGENSSLEPNSTGLERYVKKLEAIEVSMGYAKELLDVIKEASLLRLRLVLMTVFTILFRILPLLFSTGFGSVIQYRLSVLIFSGIISSSILTLLVLPVGIRFFVGEYYQPQLKNKYNKFIVLI